jgi:hypothetical protein
MWVAAVLAAALFAGCGQLRVRVDVLDPNHVQQEAADQQLRKLYHEIVAAEPGQFAQQAERDFGRYRARMIRAIEAYEAIAKPLPEGVVPASTVANWALLRQSLASGSARDRNRDGGARLEDLARDVRTFAPAMPAAGAMPAGLRPKLEAFRTARKGLASDNQKEAGQLETEVREFKEHLEAEARSAAGPTAAAAPSGAASSPAERKAAAATALGDVTRAAPLIASVQAAVRSVIENNSLAVTEFAYAVAKAQESLWAPGFNEAMGRGLFGNVDIVIRLNSTADFSVKGLLFDASKVAQVASKVMTQSLLLGAQLAGVPVATATTGTPTGGDALSGASAALSRSEAELMAREAQLESQRNAMRALARTILGSAATLETGALKDAAPGQAERAAIHRAIADSLAAMRATISLQGLR